MEAPKGRDNPRAGQSPIEKVSGQSMHAEEIRAALSGIMVAHHFVEAGHFDLDSPLPAVNAFVQQCGFKPLADGWQAIDAAGARRILVNILHRDMAYSIERMPPEDAARIADAVLHDAVAVPARFYTNGSYDKQPETLSDRVTCGPSWNPITDATFDSGVVFVTACKIGLLWIEDED